MKLFWIPMLITAVYLGAARAGVGIPIVFIIPSLCLLVGVVCVRHIAHVGADSPNFAFVESSKFQLRNLLFLTWFLLGLVSWTYFITRQVGWAPVIPNYDAIHHSNQIANIMREGTVLQESIYGNASGPALSARTAFYPHGSHLWISALSVFFTDAITGIGQFYTFMAALGIPVGTYCMLRSFGIPRSSGLLGAAATTSIGLTPLGPISWGGIPTLSGVVLLPFAIAWANDEIRQFFSQNHNHFFTAYGLESLKVLTVVVGMFFFHPSAAFLFTLYFLIALLVTDCLPLKLRFGAGSIAVVITAWPLLPSLPGAWTLRELGLIDPSRGDEVAQVGQLFLLTPNSAHRYWHLAIIAFIFPIVLLLRNRDSRRNDSGMNNDQSWREKSTNRALVLVSLIALLQVSVIMVNSGDFSFLSWPTSLWYRQYARTSYHLPLAIGVAFAFMTHRIGLWRRDRASDGIGATSRMSDSRYHVGRIMQICLILIILTPVIRGFGTYKEHQSDFFSIGPISGNTLNTTVAAIDRVSTSQADPITYVIAEFTSGAALISAKTGMPSSGEPYGRAGIAEEFWSLVSSGASAQDVQLFLDDFGEAIVLTNAWAPSSYISRELLLQSGLFDSVYENSGVELWSMRIVESL